MNRDQKSAVIDEIAASISDAQAIFAVDYRGITVEQARELRGRLREADASLRVVKNSLTERAADKAGVEQLKALLEGPTALTFVRGDGAAAAKSIADFARTTQLLAFKGGVMDGAAVSPAELTAIARLPAREVLYGQLVGLVANPITSLARTLNALISGLAIGLSGVLSQREAAGETLPAPAAETPPEPKAEAATEESATATEAPATEAAEESPSEEASEPKAEAATEEPASATEAAEESPREEAPNAGATDASSEAPATEPAEESPSEEASEPNAEVAATEEPASATEAAEESPREEAPDAGAAEASSEAPEANEANEESAPEASGDDDTKENE
jgi:large subunit ribosomal protein L10